MKKQQFQPNTDPVPHMERRDCCRVHRTPPRPDLHSGRKSQQTGADRCHAERTSAPPAAKRRKLIPSRNLQMQMEAFKSRHVRVWRAHARCSVNRPSTRSSVCSGWLPLMSLTRWCRLTACHYCHMFSSMLAPHCSTSQWYGDGSCTLVYIMQ